MRCPICRFENMPDEKACGRCGGALSASGGLAVDFMPPRAGEKKAWYPLRFRLNAAMDRYCERKIGRALSAVDERLKGTLLPTCLSLLPGLGHRAVGRWRGATTAFFVWLALALIALNAFGSDLTGVTIGLLVGWHALVVFDASLRRVLDTVRDRWMMMAIILVIIAVPYAGIHHMIYRSFDLVRVPFDDVACGLKAGDVVVVTRGSYKLEELAKGDVVAYVSTGSGRTRAGANLYLELNTRGSVVGRIEALPGDKVEISAAGLRFDPESADTVAAPRPGLPMPAEAVTLQIPEGHVLVPVPIELPRRSIWDSAVSDIWTKVFTVGPSEIQGKVHLVYQPFWRRHFIKAAHE